METLDKLDRAILRNLQADGRATYDQLSEQVGLSPSAVLRRVKRLEEGGVIDRYVALVKPESVGLGLTAYITVRLEKHLESHKRSPMDLFRASVQTWPPGGGMRGADRRDGLFAARAGAGHGALQPLHHGHAAQAPERAGLQDQFCAGPRQIDHGRAAVRPERMLLHCNNFDHENA